MLTAPVKQYLQGVHTQFVGQYSPKDGVSITSKDDDFSTSVKENVSDSLDYYVIQYILLI